MTKIDIISGFLGAGKTTLINKLIHEGYEGEKLVLIENEFGDIGIDGGFLKEAGINITEMNSGCICCSLVGDFGDALRKVISEYAPDRILIEPSGVGKLSDVIKAVKQVESDDVKLNCHTVVVDASKCKMYMKNFGEFFNDQIEHASCIIFSHADKAGEKKLDEAVSLVRAHNASAGLIVTEWNKLCANDMLATMEGKNSLENELSEMLEHEHHHHDHDEHCDCHEHHHHHHEHDEHCDCHEHHHHHHDHDEQCDCHEHHHHDHDEHCDCHEHHHHDHDEHCDCHEHEHHHHDHDEHCDCHEHEHHHHDHDEHCDCHEHGHHHHDHDEHCDCHEHGHHHHHHHADEVFTSWGRETVRAYSDEEMYAILSELANEEKYGIILRAKGIVAGKGESWVHFDYVPGEPDVRHGASAVIGKLCVIGSKINESAIAELFGVN